MQGHPCLAFLFFSSKDFCRKLRETKDNKRKCEIIAQILASIENKLYFCQRKQWVLLSVMIISQEIREIITNKLRIMAKKKLKVFSLPIEEFYKRFPVEEVVVMPSLPEGHVAKVVSVRPIKSRIMK